MLNIEEAINDAIDKVITKVINYWNSDLKNGINIKQLFKFHRNLIMKKLKKFNLVYGCNG